MNAFVEDHYPLYGNVDGISIGMHFLGMDIHQCQIAAFIYPFFKSVTCEFGVVE
jgi:hypothetical protein